MIPQIIAGGDGIGHGAKSQKDDEEGEDEATVDEDGSTSSMTREEIFHYLGRVEEFVAGQGDRDGLCARAGDSRLVFKGYISKAATSH